MNCKGYAKMETKELVKTLYQLIDEKGLLQVTRYLMLHRKDLYDEMVKRTEFLNKFKTQTMKNGKMVNTNISILERLYCLEHGLSDRPKCRYCKTEYVTRFITGKKTYSLWCSHKCQGNDPVNKEHVKTAKKRKYGNPNYNGIDKARITRQERYGGWHDSDFVEKLKATKLERYGNEFWSNSELRQKTIESRIKDNPDFWKDREKKTMEAKARKYGDPKYNNRKKFKATLGNFSMEKKEDIKQKRKNTLIETYGVDHISRVEGIQERIKNTRIEKYGVASNLDLPGIRDNIRTKLRNASYDVIITSKNYEPMFSREEYTSETGHTRYWKFRCKECGTEFESRVVSRNIVCGCPKCEGTKHKTQNAIFNTIRLFDSDSLSDLKEEAYNIIPGRYLDIYSEKSRFALEFDGLIWHSSDMKPGKLKDTRIISPSYHLEKTEECEKLGISLVHVFEDEWLKNSKLCVGMIRRILECKRFDIDIDKCEICEPDKKETERFIRKYTFWNGDGSSVRIGLRYRNRLVFLMTFSRVRHSKKYEWQICSMAELNNFSIKGAVSRVIDYFTSRYSPSSVAWFMDRRWWSTKDVPDGFRIDKITPPFAWWFKGQRRYQPHMFSRSNIRNMIPSFDPNLSTHENMKNSGYLRIYDCGKIVMEYRPKI